MKRRESCSDSFSFSKVLKKSSDFQGFFRFQNDSKWRRLNALTSAAENTEDAVLNEFRANRLRLKDELLKIIKEASEARE